MSRPGTPHGDLSPRSQPVGIPRSPRSDELRRGTPDADASAQATLAAYLNPGGITPPPNIPPRVGSFPASRQGFNSSPAAGGGAFPASFRSGRSTPIPGLDHPNALVPGSGYDTPARGRTPTLLDLDALPDEEKARVIRRHLVSREERGDSASARAPTPAEQPLGGRLRLEDAAVHFPSDELFPVQDTGSGMNTPPQGTDDDSDFPIPYSAPGADVTFVFCEPLKRRLRTNVAVALFCFQSQYI